MINFEKKLEDASDDELRRWVNERNPNFGQLPSDELTRRSLRNLEKTIRKSGDQEEKFSWAFFGFAIINIIFETLHFTFDVQSSSERTFGMISLFFAIILAICVLWKITPEIKK